MPPLPKKIDPKLVASVQPRRRRAKVSPLLSIQTRCQPCEDCDGSGSCLRLIVCSNFFCKTRFTKQQFDELWESYDETCPTCHRSHGTIYVCPACDHPQRDYQTAIVCPRDPGSKEVIEALQRELADEQNLPG